MSPIKEITLMPPPYPWPPAQPGAIADRLVAELREHPTVPVEREVKLARSGMRAYVARLLKEQGGLCPLCRKPIDLHEKGEGVLDHDHDTGRIRGVLHRSCNAAEGKISNAAARWGAKSAKYADIVPYLENLVAYLKATPKPVIYPMHKTVDERKEAQLKRSRERRAEIAAKRKLAQQQRQESK